jgi:hypothetical protein
MDNCIIAKGMIDSIGHYSRLDILSLTVNTFVTSQREVLSLSTRIENEILYVYTGFI